MLFLMDLGVLLTTCLMGYKEPGRSFFRLVMCVIQLWSIWEKTQNVDNLLHTRRVPHELWMLLRYIWVSSVGTLIYRLWIYVRKAHYNYFLNECYAHNIFQRLKEWHSEKYFKSLGKKSGLIRLWGPCNFEAWFY